MNCRSGGGGGSGKPQFISANPFRGPASIKRPTQVCYPATASAHPSSPLVTIKSLQPVVCTGWRCANRPAGKASTARAVILSSAQVNTCFARHQVRVIREVESPQVVLVGKLQVQALGATAVAMAALSSEATEAAPTAAPSKATYAALTMLMHLGCL